MRFVVNPGSGPVEHARGEWALDNIRHFVADCEHQHGIEEITVTRIPNDDEDGRYAYLLWRGTRCHLVLMPGRPLAEVRFMGETGQNPWDFPRLYVDGDSWLWQYALLGVGDFAEPEEGD